LVAGTQKAFAAARVEGIDTMVLHAVALDRAAEL